MALFFRKRALSRSLVIDVSNGSIGAAYTYTTLPGAPFICYSARLPLAPRAHESLDEAALRTLSELTTLIVREGAPELHRATGSGHVDRILVSIAAPWQETTIHIESVQKERPFQITHALVHEIMEKTKPEDTARHVADHRVIATMLNGYEIQEPFGKQAKRAEFFVLTSTIEKDFLNAVEKSLRHTFHTHKITVTAFAPAAYEALRALYPHEKDFLILDVSNVRIDIALVQRGFLIDTESVAYGTDQLLAAGEEAGKLDASLEPVRSFIDPVRNARFSVQITKAEEAWVDGIRAAVATLSQKNALPRTIFLLGDTDAREYVRRLIDTSPVRSLWLTEDTLGILLIHPGQFTSSLTNQTGLPTDVFTALLILTLKPE